MKQQNTSNIWYTLFWTWKTDANDGIKYVNYLHIGNKMDTSISIIYCE